MHWSCRLAQHRADNMRVESSLLRQGSQAMSTQRRRSQMPIGREDCDGAVVSRHGASPVPRPSRFRRFRMKGPKRMVP